MRKYLRTFLEQLPLQTYFDQMEVVLDHNDPEADELEWVREFQQRYPGRLKHIITTPVAPIGTSMNTCIRAAAGEFLTIWNVDDLRTPNSIESQVNALDEHPEAGICYGNFTVVPAFKATEGRYIHCEGYPQSELTRSMFIGPYFMFRKSLCDKAGLFDEQLKQGADFDLAVRLGFNASAVQSKADLGYYLNEGLGASTRPGTLLPIERTVIELRYGIYDKIDYRYAAQASAYDIPTIHVGAERFPVSHFVPHYEEVMRQRLPRESTQARLIRKGRAWLREKFR
jgi:glycosyltransferase involved in cell wall biosynthesis